MDEVVKKSCTSVGIITYHAAYNFGSMLQAYALQEAIKKLGCNSKIINYRMREQKEFYREIRRKYGLKTFVLDCLRLGEHKSRKIRAEKFETFIKERMDTTVEFCEPEDMKRIADCFDIIISGSDQIWNKHSCELQWNDWKYMDPYLLKGLKCKKVSYASSIANMKSEELEMIRNPILDFDYVSMRERSSAFKMRNLLGVNVEEVLDPTFLLSKEEWIDKLKLTKTYEEPYICFYALTGGKTLYRSIRNLKYIADSGYRIKVITPFAPFYMKDERFEVKQELGPAEFMNLLFNADRILTDSYHGTILALNLEKEFFSINGKNESDFRKTDILNKLGLQSRVVTWTNWVEKFDCISIDYDVVHEKVEAMRKESYGYLKKAI